MTPKQLHEQMAKCVDGPDSRLKYHRDDFETLDLRYLENTWHPGARMLWVVRESGTHIVPLGIHSKMSEEGLAILDMADSEDAPKELYLLSLRGVTRLTDSQARSELAKIDWSLDRNGRIFHKEVAIADIVDVVDVVVEGEDNALYADVDLFPIFDVEELSIGELVALRIFAECAAIAVAQSLFVQTRFARLGENDIDTMLEGMRAEWIASEEAATQVAGKGQPAAIQLAFRS